jgi:hypothetical protein
MPSEGADAALAYAVERSRAEIAEANAVGNLTRAMLAEAECARLRDALIDVAKRAVRIRENKAVVGVEASFIERGARDALKPRRAALAPKEKSNAS